MCKERQLLCAVSFGMPSDSQRPRGLPVGSYIQRHADDEAEARAQRLIGGAMHGWKESMWDRDGVMSREDGSDLRGDELRLPKLSLDRRSEATRLDPLTHTSPGQLADHAILTFHNLMRGLDSLMISDDRETIRLHLSAEFVMIRALIEAAASAVWLLGPNSSDVRITRSMRLRFTEIDFSKRLATEYQRLANSTDDDATAAQVDFVNGQLADLRRTARDAGISWSSVSKLIGPAKIVQEAAEDVPDLGPAMAYWYWSTASSIAHAEHANMSQLADLKFIGVDFRNTPIAHAEPSAASIWKHLEAALTLVARAHELWNMRAASPR